MPLEENELVEELQRRADREEGPKEHGAPSRWLEANVRRCQNDHVGTMTFKSEEPGGNACLACWAPTHLTFPEDTDGPLELTGDQPASEGDIPEWQKLGHFDGNDGWG